MPQKQWSNRRHVAARDPPNEDRSCRAPPLQTAFQNRIQERFTPLYQPSDTVIGTLMLILTDRTEARKSWPGVGCYQLYILGLSKSSADSEILIPNFIDSVCDYRLISLCDCHQWVWLVRQEICFKIMHEKFNTQRFKKFTTRCRVSNSELHKMSADIRVSNLLYLY